MVNDELIPKNNKISKIEKIYDYMRQKSSKLKITKNSYYRAISIINMLYKSNTIKILSAKNIMSLICASLCLGTKF